MQQPNEDRTFTLEQAAEYLELSVTTMGVYISTGKLPDHRAENNNEHIFYESELDAYRTAHPRGRKPNLSVVKEDTQVQAISEQQEAPELVPQKELTMRVLLDYVTRSHFEGQETVKVTFKYPEFERNGEIPYNSFIFRDSNMQAFFASIPIGQEFEMVLRKRRE